MPPDSGGFSPDRLRILFVTSDSFPPFRPAAKAIFGEDLPRRGHEIDWVLQAASPAVTAGQQPFGNGTAYVASTDGGGSRWRRLRKFFLGFFNDFKVFRLIRGGRYSLVQAKDTYLAALLALTAARRERVPFVYWLAFPHGEASLYAARTGMARYRVFYLLRGILQQFLLYRVICPAAGHVFVQSEQMRRDFVMRGVPLEKTTAVPSSINLADLDRGGAEPTDKSSGERWIVYIGTLAAERHLEFLIGMLAHVRKDVPAARLVLVGRGERPEDEAALLREAVRLGVADAVRITGWMPMRRGWEYVRSADVCVSPYAPIPILRSTSPTKLVEYMALGKPVVANDHPEQSAMLRESCAGLVTPWEERSFAEAVVYLLRHEQEAREMGRAGRAYVERHRTHERMGKLVESRYRALLERVAPETKNSAFGVAE